MFKESGISPAYEDFNTASGPLASLSYSNLKGDITIGEFGISLYAYTICGMSLSQLIWIISIDII